MTARASTKGQLHLNETILVLFVVVVILILGIFFYYKYSFQSIQTLGDELSEEEASILLAAITSMPEIRCAEVNCIDTTKAMAFSRVGREELQHYASVFGTKRILVEQVYPVPAVMDECTVQKFNQLDYPSNCGYWVIFDNKKDDFNNKLILSTPISLYQHEKGTFGIGRVVIEVYR